MIGVSKECNLKTTLHNAPQNAEQRQYHRCHNSESSDREITAGTPKMASAASSSVPCNTLLTSSTWNQIQTQWFNFLCLSSPPRLQCCPYNLTNIIPLLDSRPSDKPIPYIAARIAFLVCHFTYITPYPLPPHTHTLSLSLLTRPFVIRLIPPHQIYFPNKPLTLTFYLPTRASWITLPVQGTSIKFPAPIPRKTPCQSSQHHLLLCCFLAL